MVRKCDWEYHHFLVYQTHFVLAMELTIFQHWTGGLDPLLDLDLWRNGLGHPWLPSKLSPKLGRHWKEEDLPSSKMPPKALLLFLLVFILLLKLGNPKQLGRMFGVRDVRPGDCHGQFSPFRWKPFHKPTKCTLPMVKCAPHCLLLILLLYCDHSGWCPEKMNPRTKWFYYTFHSFTMHVPLTYSTALPAKKAAICLLNRHVVPWPQPRWGFMLVKSRTMVALRLGTCQHFQVFDYFFCLSDSPNILFINIIISYDLMISVLEKSEVAVRPTAPFWSVWVAPIFAPASLLLLLQRSGTSVFVIWDAKELSQHE